MKGVTLPTETVFVMENSPIKFGTVEVPPGIFHFFSDFSDACIVACIFDPLRVGREHHGRRLPPAGPLHRQ
jgi:hypothetical protein